ncbi:MAG: 23S rRNA (pseudouridine(1915)-N(3))-methyltransferase RlmH [Bacillota bacterium]
MMRITLILSGKIRELFFRAAATEYAKRLSPYSKVEVIETGAHPQVDMVNDLLIEQYLEKEAEVIVGRLRRDTHVVTLDERGRQLTSEEFASYLKELMVSGISDVTFLIGGAHGLSRSLKQRSQMLLSLSRMTLPHQMVPMVLLEQLYRAFRIIRNEPYHR